MDGSFHLASDTALRNIAILVKGNVIYKLAQSFGSNARIHTFYFYLPNSYYCHSVKFVVMSKYCGKSR
jgi:hypothetical protein